MTPSRYRTGKICYLEIPAKDVRQSAEFYHRAFGWQIRHIIDQVDLQAREVVATLRDPAGNLIGIYQQPGLAESEAHA